MAMEGAESVNTQQSEQQKLRYAGGLRSPSYHRILIALIGGTAVWIAHLFVVYPLNSVACQWDWFTVLQGGTSQLRLLQITTSIIAAILEAIFIWMMVVVWQQNRNQVGPDGVAQPAPQGLTNNIPFLAIVTALLDTLYLLIILASIVPVLTLLPCG
jgi:hypothetical protein